MKIYRKICLLLVIAIVILCEFKRGLKDNTMYKCMMGGFDSVIMQKAYKGELSSEKREKISKEIVAELDGKVVFEEREINLDNKNTYVLYGYSPILNNTITYNGKEINFNIVYTYMDNQEYTYVYWGNPIVNCDF